MVSIPQLKRWGSTNAGWEGTVYSHAYKWRQYPTYYHTYKCSTQHTVIHTSAVPNTPAAAYKCSTQHSSGCIQMQHPTLQWLHTSAVPNILSYVLLILGTVAALPCFFFSPIPNVCSPSKQNLCSPTKTTPRAYDMETIKPQAIITTASYRSLVSIALHFDSSISWICLVNQTNSTKQMIHTGLFPSPVSVDHTLTQKCFMINSVGEKAGILASTLKKKKRCYRPLL